MGTDAASDGVLWMLRKYHEAKGREADLATFLFKKHDGAVDLAALESAYAELEQEGVVEKADGAVGPVVCRDRVTGLNRFVTPYRLARGAGGR